VAEKSRDGFQKGVVRGMIGMALAGLTNANSPSPAIPCRLETHPVHRGILSGPGVTGRNRENSCGMPGAKQLTPRRADGTSRLARDTL